MPAATTHPPEVAFDSKVNDTGNAVSPSHDTVDGSPRKAFGKLGVMNPNERQQATRAEKVKTRRIAQVNKYTTSQIGRAHV